MTDMTPAPVMEATPVPTTEVTSPLIAEATPAPVIEPTGTRVTEPCPSPIEPVEGKLLMLFNVLKVLSLFFLVLVNVAL